MPWRPDPDRKEKIQEQIDKPKTKHNWDKKIILRCSISTATTAIFYAVWYRIRFLYKGQPIAANNNPNLKYPYQLICILLFISAVYLFFSLRKLLPKSLKDEWKAKFNRVVSRYIKGPLEKFAAKLRKIFGLPDKQRLRGQDESSFIFDLEGSNLFRRFQSVKNQLKWRDLQTNAEKIRYLYIKFVVKLIKGGYRYTSNKTPREVKLELALTDEPERLFDLYTGARYSGGRYNITDDDVEMSAKLIKKRGA